MLQLLAKDAECLSVSNFHCCLGSERSYLFPAARNNSGNCARGGTRYRILVDTLTAFGRPEHLSGACSEHAQCRQWRSMKKHFLCVKQIIRGHAKCDTTYLSKRFILKLPNIFEIRLNQFLLWRIRINMLKWCIGFEYVCVQGFANQTLYAEIECTMPSKATLLRKFVRCFYQWTRYAVLSKSAALSMKYVLIVYIRPEKGAEPTFSASICLFLGIGNFDSSKTMEQCNHSMSRFPWSLENVAFVARHSEGTRRLRFM